MVPTLLRRRDGAETDRAEGWDRARWRELSGVADLGADLTDWKPGCGSRTHDPAVAEELLVRTRGHELHARRVELAGLEDEAEALYDRGWTDGLPVVAPTPARVLRMLAGTSRAPDEVVATVPPNLVPATVEKVAINAVLAGCRPEYLPVVLAAVEAACAEEFNAHGLLATTWAAAPAVLVHGPIARRIGINTGGNALGQGTRANSTIGRALQLVIRNVGGGRPGEVDRATLGQPGKVGLCFAEDEQGSPWEPLSVSRGVPAGASAVTVFAAEGAQGVVDQISRTPGSLARSLAPGAARRRAPQDRARVRRGARGRPRARARSSPRRAGTGPACTPSSTSCSCWRPRRSRAAPTASTRACRRHCTSRWGRVRSSGPAG